MLGESITSAHGGLLPFSLSKDSLGHWTTIWYSYFNMVTGETVAFNTSLVSSISRTNELQ